jgi:hypothetical protein
MPRTVKRALANMPAPAKINHRVLKAQIEFVLQQSRLPKNWTGQLNHDRHNCLQQFLYFDSSRDFPQASHQSPSAQPEAYGPLALPHLSSARSMDVSWRCECVLADVPG